MEVRICGRMRFEGAYVVETDHARQQRGEVGRIQHFVKIVAVAIGKRERAQWQFAYGMQARQGVVKCGQATIQCHQGQIGRASCRERVCQYVSISVGAVSLNKKNKDITVTKKKKNIK